jgi:hypothetical protein
MIALVWLAYGGIEEGGAVEARRGVGSFRKVDPKGTRVVLLVGGGRVV